MAEAASPNPLQRESWLVHEARLMLTALQFFTRVPVPRWVGWSPAQLNAAMRWFPLIGIGVGAVCVVGAFVGTWIAGASFGAALAVAAGVCITGGFHEDGLADTCDGLGGGWTRDQTLAIMKDSRVGSYAVLGVVLVLAGKLALIAVLINESIGSPFAGYPLVPALLAAHGVSRWLALSVVRQYRYVRDDDSSRSKPVADSVSTMALCVAALPLLPLLAWLGMPAIGGVAAAAVVRLVFAHGVARRLSGYTGDTLGATQQLCELAFYAGAVAWLHHAS